MGVTALALRPIAVTKQMNRVCAPIKIIMLLYQTQLRLLLNKKTVLPSTQGDALKSTIIASTNSFIFSRTGQFYFHPILYELRSLDEMPMLKGSSPCKPRFRAFFYVRILSNATLDVIRCVTNVVLMEVLEGLEGLMC